MTSAKPSLISKINQRLDTQRGRRILLLGTAIVLALLFFQSIKPTLATKSETSKQNQSMTAQNEETKKEIEVFGPQIERSKASDLTASLNTALPASATADRQLIILSKLADQTNVELPTFEPSQPDGKGTSYQLVPANLAIKGTLENCLRFLGGLKALVTVKGQEQVKAYGPVWTVSQLALAPDQLGGEVSMNLTSGYYIEGTDTEQKPGSQPADPQGAVK